MTSFDIITKVGQGFINPLSITCIHIISIVKANRRTEKKSNITIAVSEPPDSRTNLGNHAGKATDCTGGWGARPCLYCRGTG